MRKFGFKKGFLFLLLFAGGILLFGAAVMGLWNAILTVVLGVKAISFVQALGILLLSKILFGSFGNRCGRCGRGAEMREKWQNMTPEEREKFKSDWRSRCGRRKGMDVSAVL